jgi:hypothetical protein
MSKPIMAKLTNAQLKLSEWGKIFRIIDMTNPKVVEKLLGKLVTMATNLGETIPKDINIHSMAHLIASYEHLHKNVQYGSLSMHSSFKRRPEWTDGWKRLELHSKIVYSLVNNPRPANDEEITLNNGGAQPKSGIKNENLAIIVTGPPACGKSTFCSPLAERKHSLIIDADDAKRMLPEYQNGLHAGPLHEESSVIVKGNNGVLQCAVSTGMNIVYPTIGANANRLKELRNELTLNGYQAYLISFYCPIEIAAVRSLLRMKHTGRYISLKHLLTEVGDSPIEAFHKAKHDGKWAGYAWYDATKNPAILVKTKNWSDLV